MKDERQIIEFLDHSNRIEKEYSLTAMGNAIKAWVFSIKNIHYINKNDNNFIDYLKRIHFELLCMLNPKIAGKFRNCAVYIGGEKKENIGEKAIEEKLVKWFKDYWDLTSFSEIKQAHIKFEEIHPFQDGNGRVGRILMNIQRVNAGLPILIIHEGEEQMEYYKWFDDESKKE